MKKHTPAMSFCARVASLVLLVSGCGGINMGGNVEGTITLDGSPLPDAVVTFVPDSNEGGSTALGRTDSDGKYTLSHGSGKGAKPGKYKVSVSTHQSGDPDSDPPKPRVKEKVPPKYNRSTTLKAEVKSGKNPPIDFDLKSR